jgi:hypothetical protein
LLLLAETDVFSYHLMLEADYTVLRQRKEIIRNDNEMAIKLSPGKI